MAKGQMKSNKEKRKPKKDRPKEDSKPASFGAALERPAPAKGSPAKKK